MSLHLMIYMNCNDPTKDPDLNELWGFSGIGPIMLTIFQEQAYQIKYFDFGMKDAAQHLQNCLFSH